MLLVAVQYLVCVPEKKCVMHLILFIPADIPDQKTVKKLQRLNMQMKKSHSTSRK